MKRLLVHILSFSLVSFLTISQGATQSFYFSGAFVDRQDKPIAYVNIKPFASPISFQAGNSGEFGLPSYQKADSAWCYLEGYDSLLVLLQHGKYQKFVLEMQPSFAEKLIKASRLSSFTRLPQDMLLQDIDTYSGPGESYHRLVANQWNKTAIAPFTGFVPNSNKSSYANIRRFVRQQSRIPPNAIRTEELWNYFSLNAAGEPAVNGLFSLKAVTTECPWNAKNRVVVINAVAKRINIDSLPPVNMVFLIDNSGSMEEANRLPLLKSGFKKMVDHLRPKDRVGIVTYGGAAGIFLPPTFGTEKEKIRNALDSIEAGGVTPGANGIQLAYELVTTNAFENGVNKVILATDGDFNIGVANESDLETLIGRYRSTGVTLSCVGVGMGNYKDSKIEVLARIGNGSFAYLDTDDEAEKALLMQLGESMFTIAKDVTIQFGFNETMVKQYKLIGYENKIEALKVIPQQLVGSEVSSGQCIIGMAEIEPVDTTSQMAGSPGFFELQYKWPTHDSLERQLLDIPGRLVPLQSADSTIKIAVALAWMGMELKANKAANQYQFSQAQKLASQAGSGTYKAAIDLAALLETIRKIYEPPPDPKKEKKRKEKSRD